MRLLNLFRETLILLFLLATSQPSLETEAMPNFHILVSRPSEGWQVSLYSPAATKYLSVQPSTCPATLALTLQRDLSYLKSHQNGKEMTRLGDLLTLSQ